MPELSLPAQAFIRAAYGVLLVVMLAGLLPHGRRFFVSERWGGYLQSSRAVDALLRPPTYPYLMAGWLCCAALLAVGQWTLWTALANLLLCYYFFIRTRWRGVGRGLGAPGFMAYWLGAAVFLLELTREVAPSARPLCVLVLQVDFALIMLSAGLYKFSAGYSRNHGMDYGLVNPAWGYWWKRYAARSPRHWTFGGLNQLSWTSEIATGALLLVSPTRFLGGLLLIASFLFVATQIRLGVLCEMVMLVGVLYFPAGGIGDRLLTRLMPGGAHGAALGAAAWPPAVFLLEAALWTYLALLPLAHAGLFYNLYAGRTLPAPLQRALERYTNIFGIIVWRVFSADLINFFVLISRQQRVGGQRTVLSRYGLRDERRYNHVCEAITVTSLFTTLKYYPSNPALFQERLLRYARTVPCPPDSLLVFEQMMIRKTAERYEFVPAAEYIVDPVGGAVEERASPEAATLRAAPAWSPVREGARPGSYAPLGG